MQEKNMKGRKMLTTKVTYIIFFITCAVLIAGCRKKASEEVDAGVVENSVYSNKYFGMSVTLPTDWNIQNQKSLKQLMEMGKKMVAGEDKNLNAAIKASESQTINLVIATKHPVGSPVDFNPMIACVAERVGDMPGIKRGSDYQFHVRKLLESSQMAVSFPKETTTEKIGGRDFDVMHIEMAVATKVVKEKYYTIIAKGYAVSFVGSFTNDEEEEVMDNVIKTIIFK
jgi:hypothetical protein